MPFKDMREFIQALDKHGEMQRVNQEVHWNLEAGAILRRTYERELPAPFFQKIEGYPEGYRMFGGSLSRLRRVAITLGMNPDSSYRELMEEYLKRKKKLMKPRLCKEAPCKENIHIGDDINLFEFPAPMLHEGDGGRYLCTWAATVTKDPDTRWSNWGMYRAMIHTRNSLGGIVEPYQHIGMHYYRKYEARNKPMPFAIAIGPEPVSTFCALTKVPYGISEAEVAGGLRGEPVEVVKCETVDLEVPATSEIVIEGEMPPKERASEGPFGEFTGYRASPRDRRPIYKVKAITHRHNPILAISCMGVPMDDSHVPTAITVGADLLSELRSRGVPVVDLCSYAQCATFMTVVSVKAAYSNIAERVAHIVWGSEEAQNRPYVIVVQDDVDPSNVWQVLHALATKCHPYRGITKLERAVCTTLTPFLNLEERRYRLGAKAYFDCTWPLDWDPSIAVPPRASFDDIYSREMQEHVLKNWKNYGYKES